MDYQTLLDACVKQEEQYQFERFSRQDALDFGLKLYENVKKGGVPVAIEIAVNGLVVFRYFPEGTVADSGLWLARKRRAVDRERAARLDPVCVRTGEDQTAQPPQLLLEQADSVGQLVRAQRVGADQLGKIVRMVGG